MKISGYFWNTWAIIYHCFFNLHDCTFKFSTCRYLVWCANPANIRLDEDVLETSSRRLSSSSSEDVFKTSCKNVFKTSSRRPQDLPRSHLWEIYGQCTKFARVTKVSQILVSHFTVPFSGSLQIRILNLVEDHNGPFFPKILNGFF